MTHVFAPNEIELANGNPFSPAHPDHRMLDLESIAYSLAGVYRYGSHSRPRLTVAEHAVFVSSKLRRLGCSLSLQLAGLHHDDTEALNGIGDVQRPAKGLLDETFHERERHIDHAVWRALAWPDKNRDPLWQTVQLRAPLLKRVDTWACLFEARLVMRSRGEGWEQTVERDAGAHPIPTDDGDGLDFWGPDDAERRFINRHDTLVWESLRLWVAA